MDSLMDSLMTMITAGMSGALEWRDIEWLWALGVPLVLWLFKQRGRARQQHAYADAHLWAWVTTESITTKNSRAFAKHRGGQATRLTDILSGLFQTVKGLVRSFVNWLISPSKLLTIGWVCLVIALAGPRSMVASEDLQSREGVDILVSMDLSHSMTAEDIYPNRFLFAKSLVESMVSGLEQGDRLALQGFAGRPHMISPLSFDRGLFKHSLGLIEPDILPLKGTWIDLAVVDGLGHLAQTAGKAKIMVIFTNGAPEFWKPVDAPQAIQDSPFYRAKKQSETGVKIIVVGVGQLNATTLKDDRDKSGKLHANGLLVKSRLEENRLLKLAQSVGGVYLRAEPGQAFIDKLLKEVTLPAASRSVSQSHAAWHRYAQPFMVVGLLSLLLAFYLLTPLISLISLIQRVKRANKNV